MSIGPDPLRASSQNVPITPKEKKELTAKVEAALSGTQSDADIAKTLQELSGKLGIEALKTDGFSRFKLLLLLQTGKQMLERMQTLRRADATHALGKENSKKLLNASAAVVGKALAAPFKKAQFKLTATQEKREEAHEMRQLYMSQKIGPKMEKQLQPLQAEIDAIQKGRPLQALSAAERKAIGKIHEKMTDAKLAEIAKSDASSRIFKRTGEKVSVTPEKSEKIDERIARKMADKTPAGNITWNEISQYLSHIAVNGPYNIKAEKEKGLSDAQVKALKQELDGERDVFKRALPTFIAEVAAKWKGNPPTNMQEAIRKLGPDFVAFVYERRGKVLDEADKPILSPAHKKRWEDQFQLDEPQKMMYKNFFNDPKIVAAIERYLKPQ